MDAELHWDFHLCLFLVLLLMTSSVMVDHSLYPILWFSVLLPTTSSLMVDQSLPHFMVLSMLSLGAACASASCHRSWLLFLLMSSTSFCDY
ncbi:hypothetical protein AAC387_Pa02g1645 [Persea americana]